MARFRMTCIGTSPLLMHNSRLANPLDPIVKEIRVYSKKRTKTDDDHEQLAKLEHAGGMYYADGVGPYIPGANVRKVLIEAARKTKQGKLIEQGVFIDTLYNPLAYDGPRDLEGLWADKNFVDVACVKVMNARLMRTRPVFHTWACSTEATYDKTLLDFKQINEIAQTAGAYIGLGDYRPLYGRFRVEVEELSDEPATAAAA